MYLGGGGRRIKGSRSSTATQPAGGQPGLHEICFKTKQDKTKQNKTKQNKTKQNTTLGSYMKKQNSWQGMAIPLMPHALWDLQADSELLTVHDFRSARYLLLKMSHSSNGLPLLTLSPPHIGTSSASANLFQLNCCLPQELQRLICSLCLSMCMYLKDNR